MEAINGVYESSSDHSESEENSRSESSSISTNQSDSSSECSENEEESKSSGSQNDFHHTIRPQNLNSDSNFDIESVQQLAYHPQFNTQMTKVSICWN